MLGAVVSAADSVLLMYKKLCMRVECGAAHLSEVLDELIMD